MKILLLLALIVISSSVYAQNYERQYNNPAQSSRMDETDRMLDRQRNSMKNENEREMRKIELQQSIQEYNLIHGGTRYNRNENYERY